METQQHQEKQENVADKKEREEKEEEEGKSKQEGKEAQSTSSTINNPPVPSSSSSSPSHDFSFTISLHPSSTVSEKTKTHSSFAIDLSPADDIFFHGHLLPLHFLSHLPVSPRTSTNSLDSFTLPIKDFSEDGIPNTQIHSSNNNKSNPNEKKGKNKVKSFPLFGLSKWRKGYEKEEQEEDHNEEKKKKKNEKKKMRFDVTQILRRYARMVRPYVFFKGGSNNKENTKFLKKPYSFSGFSGNLNSREKHDWKGIRGGGFSAPVSMRNSPTNSGLLVATSTFPSSTNDSSMEELQSAIQAAIAHCKNSIAMKERNSKSEISLI